MLMAALSPASTRYSDCVAAPPNVAAPTVDIPIGTSGCRNASRVSSSEAAV